MSKYRFAGTIKEISIDTTNIILKFTPDQEFISSYRKDKETTTYAILQPVDDKDAGWVFKYSDYVNLTTSKGYPCHHLTLSLHCRLELDVATGSGLCDVTFSDVPVCATSINQFAITSINAL